MKSMDLHQDHNGNGLIAVVMWIGGIICMVSSNHQPSEVRAWITFGLGASASLISIIMNWGKFVDVMKTKFKKKSKTKQHGK